MKRRGFGIVAAVFAWSAGCAHPPRPAIDPFFAARSYTPARVALLPPDAFVIYDEVGENDPRKSAELGRAVADHLARGLVDGLSRKGYALDTSAGWDGVHAPDGQITLGGQDLGVMAGGILQFSASPAGGVEGTMPQPVFVNPDLARRIGAATGDDTILYVNVKGVAVSPGKRAAQVAGVVFFVVILAVVVLLIISESKGHGSSGSSAVGQGFRGGPARAVHAAPAPPIHPGAGAPTRARITSPRGYGMAPSGGGPVYGNNFVLGVGVGMSVPVDGPVATHEGAVKEEDRTFAGDQAYVTMSMVSTYDGRVLWHLRGSFDVELDDPRDVQRFVSQVVQTIPPALPPAAPAGGP
jgi:hypothetical protein